MFDVQRALRDLVAKDGSDLHLKVGAPPLFRVHGELAGEPHTEALAAEDTVGALKELLTNDAKSEEFVNADADAYQVWRRERFPADALTVGEVLRAIR